jgi:hypothetical protein
MSPSRGAHAALWLLLASRCGADWDPASLTTLASGEPVEYEQYTSEAWKWFLLDTNDAAGVVAGIVAQRGSGDNFPRMGLILIASSTAVPPGAISGVDIDPTTYGLFDEDEGARLQYLWDSPTTPRALTDWKVTEVGFDYNATADRPGEAQVPVGRALVGVRCNEAQWTGSIAGCRYTLTATLLPFVLADGDVVRAPMGRGGVHVFSLLMSDYDSLTVVVERDGVARIASHRVASRRIASHRVASRRIASHAAARAPP